MHRPSLVLALVGTVFSAVARSQWVEADAQAIWSIDGGEVDSLFGWRIEPVGDIDADGVIDVVVAAPFDDSGAGSGGRVSAHSGRDGSLLWERASRAPIAVLGFSLETLRDLNGDGLREVISGGPFSAAGGEVLLCSGKDGVVLHKFTPASSDSLGFSIATDGDYDGDGIDDIAIGATTAAGTGRVFVHSTAGLGLVATLGSPVAPASRFGSEIAFVGDVTGDQRDELAIGVRNFGDDPPGRVEVFTFDGSTSSVLYTIDGVTLGYGIMGDFLRGDHDLDLDGFRDLLLSDRGDGVVWLFSGVNGDLVYSIAKADVGFGSGHVVDDLNGDGRPDLLIGATSDSSGAQWGGRLYVISGKDGSELRTMTHTVPEAFFGTDALSVGDLSGDGVAEMAVSASGGSSLGHRGFVYLMAGAPCPASWTNYGTGFPGTNGIPGLTASADPELGRSFDLQVGNSRGTTTVGVLVLGTTPASIPGSWGGSLLVLPLFVVPMPLPASGLVVSASVPVDATLCGRSLYLQVLESDPGALRGVSATPGLQLVLGGS